MKKILACMSLVFALSAGATAMTIEDITNVDGGNSLTYTSTGYKTVLITKNDADQNATNDAIVYVDQADEGGLPATFLLSTEAGVGDYTLKLGGGSSTFTPVSFSIVDASTGEGGDETPDTPVAGEAVPATLAYSTKTNVAGSVYEAGFTLFNLDSVGRDAILIEATNATNTSLNKKLYIKTNLPTVSGGLNLNAAIIVTDIPDEYTVNVSYVAYPTQD